MASEQGRRDNTTNEREIHVEKDTVPKITIQFESKIEKAKGSDITSGKETPRESGRDQSHDSRARSGNAAREVGAPGKARESKELGTHEFESLAGKVKDREKQQQHERDQKREENADKARNANLVADKEAEAKKGGEEQEKPRTHTVGKFEMTVEEGHEGQERGREMQGKEGGREKQERGRGMQGKEKGHEKQETGREMEGKETRREKKEQPSLEEISKARGIAQQNSMEALRAAQERYNQVKEEASRKLGPATEYLEEKGSQTKDTVVQGAQKTAEYVKEKGSQAKDRALEKGQQGYEAAKETIYNAGKTAKDYTVPKAEQTKEYAKEKATGAKEAVVDTSRKVASYTEETATEAKEAVVDTGKKVANYTEEKASVAKDATVKTGKGAAELAGQVKDKAVLASWSTAHYTTEKAVDGTAAVAKAAQYTTEKAVEGTKAAVRAVGGVAGYAGHKAAEIVTKPLSAAKEAAVHTGESMKEYTARKKEEAEREVEAKRSTGTQHQDTERSYQGGDIEGEQQSLTTKAQEKVEEVRRPITNTIQETFQGVSEQGEEKGIPQYEGDENRGGVLRAIGETVVEIAQTTRDIVIGESETGEEILGYGSSQEHKQGEGRHGQ